MTDAFFQCVICGRRDASVKKYVHIEDHSRQYIRCKAHMTNAIRGLISSRALIPYEETIAIEIIDDE